MENIERTYREYGEHRENIRGEHRENIQGEHRERKYGENIQSKQREEVWREHREHTEKTLIGVHTGTRLYLRRWAHRSTSGSQVSPIYVGTISVSQVSTIYVGTISV